MASLASKDNYLQSLARKVCAPDSTGQRKRPRAHGKDGEEQPGAAKRKKKPRKPKQDGGTQRGPAKPSNHISPKLQRPGMPQNSFSAVDILRKRLHEKIEESRGLVSNKSLSTEEIEKKRQRRKHERERKKRKRKALRLKAAQEAAVGEVSASEKTEDHDGEEKPEKPLVPMVFNKVEVHNELLNKVMLKKEKKERVKGNITPMTGKNYKQLLSRLEARKSKLEELRAKDQEKAKEFESKIKWTNVLYKAEGLKIKDNEGMLKTALKRKEKQREQKKKRWDNRMVQTCEKMQQRQDKRTRNIKKKKVAKLEKKKNRARKRGRVMPEDLAKANIK